MLKYRATAYNEINATFQFFFWGYGTEKEAQQALDGIVAADKMHQKYGPWMVRGVSREA